MNDDPVGTVRQNPETKAVALRTSLPNLPWFISTVDSGGGYHDHEESGCEDWPILKEQQDATDPS